jgi:hypothetical protein
VAAHHFGRPLKHIGFGGTGKPAPDILYVDDLCDLVADHVNRPADVCIYCTVAGDIAAGIRENEAAVRPLLGR